MEVKHSINEYKIFDGITVAAASTSASLPADGLDLAQTGPYGNFSAEIIISGSGSATVGFLCSGLDGSRYVKPSKSSAIATPLVVASALTSTGSPDGNGSYFFPITNLPLSGKVKFYCEAITDDVVITFILHAQ